MTLSIAETLAGVADRLGLLLIFKASFDKANRSSDKSFRGLGIDEGLRILEKVRAETGLPVITDVHEAAQVAPVASVVDVLQTPAFLARQTDFIAAVAASGKPVNIKKAQFMAPADMQQVVNKARNAASAAGHDPDAFLLCERGTSFGYNTLVSDMRGLAIMADTGCPVVFDATHSVQQPGGLGERSGGQREFVPCSPAPPWPPASRACSWKPTPIRTRPCRTAPTPCPSPISRNCGSGCWRSTRW
jgi:2-dehydro-3-deoxyphosphooctonate aldolase (KDO 8-P synthase)